MVIIEHETIITATKSAVINLTKLIFFRIMMVSAMRRDDGCDARLACRLGGLAKESGFFSRPENRKMILGAINQVKMHFKAISHSIYRGLARILVVTNICWGGQKVTNF